MSKEYDEMTFVQEFVKLANEHNACLATKEYSKRSRINKKLMGMLRNIDSFEAPKAVIIDIIESGDDYALMWISNYAWKNGLCIELVREKLSQIRDSKRGPDSIMAWALIKENTR